MCQQACGEYNNHKQTSEDWVFSMYSQTNEGGRKPRQEGEWHEMAGILNSSTPHCNILLQDPLARSIDLNINFSHKIASMDNETTGSLSNLHNQLEFKTCVEA